MSRIFVNIDRAISLTNQRLGFILNAFRLRPNIRQSLSDVRNRLHPLLRDDARFSNVDARLAQIESRVGTLHSEVIDYLRMYEHADQTMLNHELRNGIAETFGHKRWHLNHARHSDAIERIHHSTSNFSRNIGHIEDFIGRRSRGRDTWTLTIESGRLTEFVSDFARGEVSNEQLYIESLERLLDDLIGDKRYAKEFEDLKKGIIAGTETGIDIRFEGEPYSQIFSGFITVIDMLVRLGGSIDDILNMESLQDFERLYYLVEMRESFINNGASESQIAAIDRLIEKYSNLFMASLMQIANDINGAAAELSLIAATCHPLFAKIYKAAKLIDLTNRFSGQAEHSDRLRDFYPTVANLAVFQREYIALIEKIGTGDFTQADIDRADFLYDIIKREQRHVLSLMIEIERRELEQEIALINEMIPDRRELERMIERITRETNDRIAEYEQAIRRLDEMPAGIEATPVGRGTVNGTSRGVIEPVSIQGANANEAARGRASCVVPTSQIRINMFSRRQSES